MHYRIRKVIFLIFLSFFLISAPLVVLYTAGYRLNFSTFRIQQTGGIALSSSPKGATVFLNGESIGNKTPYVIQRLSPGNYAVRLERDGYQPWEQHVDVTSGTTAYVSATLFADVSPEFLFESNAIATTGDQSGRFVYLLLPENIKTKTQSILQFDTVTRVSKSIIELPEIFESFALNFDETTLILHSNNSNIGVNISTGSLLENDALTKAIDPLADYTFFDNGTNTEFKDTTTNTLISLLPPGEYSVTFVNKQHAMFVDTRNRTYLFNFATKTVTQIALPTTLVAKNKDESLFIGSDGNEIDLYDVTTSTTTLLTRQSEQIIAISWHTDDQTILYATTQRIFAISREKHETRDSTTLVEQDSISGMWPESNGKRITYFGTENEQTGIWSIALTQ